MIHTCAYLSRQAYEDKPSVNEVGHYLVDTFDINGTQGFVSCEPDENSHDKMFLTFRGTEPEDYLTDLNYVKTDWMVGGRVHKGFSNAFKQVHNHVQCVIDQYPKNKWIFTGHSLGGALAMLAASYWPPEQVHTFGCPRVGNSGFVKTVLCKVHRYENWDDPVPYLPTITSPRQIFSSLIGLRRPTFYRHAGRVIRMCGVGHSIKQYESAASLMKELKHGTH